MASSVGGGPGSRGGARLAARRGGAAGIGRTIKGPLLPGSRPVALGPFGPAMKGPSVDRVSPCGALWPAIVTGPGPGVIERWSARRVARGAVPLGATRAPCRRGVTSPGVTRRGYKASARLGRRPPAGRGQGPPVLGALPQVGLAGEGRSAATRRASPLHAPTSAIALVAIQAVATGPDPLAQGAP